MVEPGLHGAGAWAVRFDPFPHVKLGVIAHGECWLALEATEPVLLREGDSTCSGNPPRYVLASDLTAKSPWPARACGSTATNKGVRVGPQVEEDTYVCGGHFFSFDHYNAPDAARRPLPPLVLVRATDPRGRILARLSELLVNEVATDDAGRTLVLSDLAQIVLIHMLRAHVAQTTNPTGWLGALADDEIGAALRAMHADLAHPWTLAELAAISHMSRSAFAAAFKRRVGTAPLNYLIQWRMNLARDALRHSTRSISQLAAARAQIPIRERVQHRVSPRRRLIPDTSPKRGITPPCQPHHRTTVRWPNLHTSVPVPAVPGTGTPAGSSDAPGAKSSGASGTTTTPTTPPNTQPDNASSRRKVDTGGLICAAPPLEEGLVTDSMPGTLATLVKAAVTAAFTAGDSTVIRAVVSMTIWSASPDADGKFLVRSVTAFWESVLGRLKFELKLLPTA